MLVAIRTLFPVPSWKPATMYEWDHHVRKLTPSTWTRDEMMPGQPLGSPGLPNEAPAKKIKKCHIICFTSHRHPRNRGPTQPRLQRDLRNNCCLKPLNIEVVCYRGGFLKQVPWNCYKIASDPGGFKSFLCCKKASVYSWQGSFLAYSFIVN